jgi:acetyltransferase-like isoleucine patch superfamily enzyme
MGGAMNSLIKYLYFGILGKIHSIIVRIKQFVDFIYLRYHGVETSFGYVKLLGFPIIQRVPGSVIKIGKGVTLVSSLKHNIAGINHPVILATLHKNAAITIDDGSGASGTVICAVNKISIGKHVALGANCKIYDSDFHPVQPGKRLRQKSILDARNASVIIGDHTWIGEGAIVLKGACMELGAVLSARSVLNTRAAAFSIYTGNPAVFVKKFDDDLAME